MVDAQIIAPYLPFFWAAGALVAWALAWWSLLLPRLAILLLVVSLVIGQAVRLPLPGQGGGLLLTDLAAVLVLAAAAVRYRKLPADRRQAIFKLALLFSPFIIWSLFSLVINVAEAPAGQAAVAFLYWVRLSVCLLSLPALLVLVNQEAERRLLIKGLFMAGWILVGFGFLQIVAAPNLAAVPAWVRLPANYFQAAGWDPHQGRLVSTWLDPNFFGGFLVIMLPIVLALSASRSKVVFLMVVVSALAFTQSRSSIVSLLAAAVIFGPLAIQKYISAGINNRARVVKTRAFGGLIICWLLAAGLILGDRLGGLWNIDDTVTLRWESLKLAWTELAQKHYLLGVGYNNYQYAAADAGLINSFATHSRAGADNSWLTLWVTTGIVGVSLFLTPWLKMFFGLIRDYSVRGNAILIAGPCGILALFIHSQFVNSFLYSHLLLTLIIVTSLSLSEGLVNQRQLHAAR